MQMQNPVCDIVEDGVRVLLYCTRCRRCFIARTHTLISLPPPSPIVFDKVTPATLADLNAMKANLKETIELRTAELTQATRVLAVPNCQNCAMLRQFCTSRDLKVSLRVLKIYAAAMAKDKARALLAYKFAESACSVWTVDVARKCHEELEAAVVADFALYSGRHCMIETHCPKPGCHTVSGQQAFLVFCEQERARSEWRKSILALVQ